MQFSDENFSAFYSDIIANVWHPKNEGISTETPLDVSIFSSLLKRIKLGRGFSYSILDLSSQKYLHVGDGHHEMTGIPDGEMYADGLAAKTKFLWKEDQAAMAEIPEQFNSILSNFTVEDKINISCNYDVRLHHTDGSDVRILEMNHCLQLSQQNKPWIYLTFYFDISHLKRMEAPMLVRYNLNGKNLGLYQQNGDGKLQNIKRLFTPSEFQILRYTVKGLSIKQINQHIKGSEATIALHRKHLCRKVGAFDAIALTALSKMEVW